MRRHRNSRQPASFLEIFVDPLFGAFGAFLFIFLMVILMIGITGRTPNILTEQLPDAFRDIPYAVWLSAEGGVGEYRWAPLNSDDLPPGLVLDPNGYVRGIPQVAAVANVSEEYQFDVKVHAERLKAEEGVRTEDRRRYKVVVHRDCPIKPEALPPLKILTISPLPDGTVGKPYNVTLAACGGVPPYTWSHNDALPPDLKLEPSTGRIVGVPGRAVREANLNVKVLDERRLQVAGAHDSRELTLSVFPPPKEPPPPPPPPQIVTKDFPPLIEGLPHELGVVVRYGVQPFKWTAEAKPSWLRLDEGTGILRGTPRVGSRGTVTVTLTVRDALDRPSQTPFTDTVEIRPQRGLAIDELIVLSKVLPPATINTAYVAPLALRGGAPPYRFNAQALPKGLSIDEKGLIKGSPDTPGTFTFHVDVTDSLDPPQRAQAALSLAVDDRPGPLRIVTESKLPDGRVGKSYDVALAATGGNGLYEWKTPDRLPSGLRLAQGRVRGTPSNATGRDATFRVTVRCAGANPMRTQQQFNLTILSRKEIPSFRSPRWLWLAAILAVSTIAKSLWRRYCLMHIRFQ